MKELRQGEAVERGGDEVGAEHDCSSDGPGSEVGTRKARKVPELETKNWKGVGEMRYRSLFLVPGDRPKDAL